MKKLQIFCVMMVAIMAQFASAQIEVTPPTEGKAVVYFVRTNQTGSLINFKYFDGETYLGKRNGRHYFRYECEPGKHIFWAKSENFDFVEAELKADAIYFIEVKGVMGGFSAGVKLFTVDFSNAKQMKKIRKVFEKKELTVMDATAVAEEAPKLEKKIQKVLGKIQKKIQKGKTKKITPAMEYIKE